MFAGWLIVNILNESLRQKVNMKRKATPTSHNLGTTKKPQAFTTFNPPRVAVSYVGSGLVFLLAYVLPGLPILPYPFAGNLLSVFNIEPYVATSDVQTVLVSLFVFHFIRRSFEVIFVHKYTRSLADVGRIGAKIYYWSFAFWIGLSIRPGGAYTNTGSPVFVAGVTLFCIGEVGNCTVHVQLRNLRVKRLNQPR